MIKRVLAIALSLAAVCVLLCSSAAETTTPDESLSVDVHAPVVAGDGAYIDTTAKRMRILIIGNSHSIDAFHLLYMAYKDQYPNTDLCLGICHYNGASIDEHVRFARRNSKAYRYLKNEKGRWVITIKNTMKSVLRDEPWDVIMIQPAKEDLADKTLNLSGRRALESKVDHWMRTPYKLIWHISWPSPNDEMFFSPDYVRQPPKGYKDKLTRLYGFNPKTQFSLMLCMTRAHILEDDTYYSAVCSGTSVMQAHLEQGVPQSELWRDYTHLSDYGRLMVGYALVVQLTGCPIEEVGVDTIDKYSRHVQYRDLGDMTVTEEMKRSIVIAANHTLENAWVMPTDPTDTQEQ